MKTLKVNFGPAKFSNIETETSIYLLKHLFGKIWENEEIPEDWKEGYIVKLPKKGDLRDCKSYRGIESCLKDRKDEVLRDKQADFR